MKTNFLQIATTFGISIGTAIGVAIGISIGIATLGMLGVEMHSALTLWIGGGLAVGAGISLTQQFFKRAKNNRVAE
jgi:hypothetical protein